jgi:hypothetical protein
MASINNPDWDAISAIVTAIGVLTALALGVQANLLQYKQARKKEEQDKVLARAWAASLSTDVANTLVLAKKMRIKLEGLGSEQGVRQLLEYCQEASLIDSSYAQSFIDRLDVFPLVSAQSIAVFHTEVRRLKLICEKIKSGEDVHLPDGSGPTEVLKKSLDSIIGYGEWAMGSLYSVSGIGSPPNIEDIASRSISRDKSLERR